MDGTGIANFVLVSAFEGFYLGLMIYFIFKLTKQASGPMFERSGYLIIFSNILNILEVVLNFAIGLSSYIKKSKTTEKVFINLIIFTSRVYAACTFLRMIRIIVLYKFRKGEIPRTVFLKLSSFKFIYILYFIYATLSLLMISLIILKYDINPDVLPYINNACYTIEASSFFLLSVITFKFNIYPCLFVEYLIYSLLWFISGFEYGFEFKDRWLLEIPIRNNILVLISWISIKIDYDNQRPPLPAELSLLEIFQIKELYYNFYDYAKKYSDESQVYACHALKELAKGSFYQNYEGIDIKGTELKERLNTSLGELLDESLYDCLKDGIRENLQGIFDEYCTSQEFSSFKRNYFIDYNYQGFSSFSSFYKTMHPIVQGQYSHLYLA